MEIIKLMYHQQLHIIMIQNLTVAYNDKNSFANPIVPISVYGSLALTTAFIVTLVLLVTVFMVKYRKKSKCLNMIYSLRGKNK